MRATLGRGAMTSAGARLVDWSNLTNARDLGGLPSSDGPTQMRRVVRADSLCRLTKAGRKRLLAGDLGRIIDLRTPGERAVDISPMAGFGEYYTCSVQVTDDRADPRHPCQAPDLFSMYVGLIDRGPELFARAASLIATAPPGLVVIHCHSGKDRTGLLAALVLSHCKVADEHIAGDYAIRGPGLVRLAERQVMATPRSDRPRAIDRLSAQPATMAALLNYVDSRYGGATRYLLSAGLTSEDGRELRRRMLRSSNGGHGQSGEGPVQRL